MTGAGVIGSFGIGTRAHRDSLEPAAPGDRLRMELRFVRMAGDVPRLRATARIEAGIAASGDQSLSIVTTKENET